MTAIVKFHEKSQSLFTKIETVAGTYETGIVGTDALAVLNLDGSVTYETESYAYIGDPLSRDETTYTKDSYADFTCETPQQVLGTLSATITAATAPISQELQACGGYVTAYGTSAGSGYFADGTVFVDNTRESNTTISIDYRKTSAEDAVNQKLQKFIGCRGMVDVSADVGSVPKLKFNFKGNANNPEAAAILAADFGSQTTKVSAAIRQTNIVTAEIASLSDAFTSLGVTVSGITFVANIARATTAAGLVAAAGAIGTVRYMTISGSTESSGYYNGTFLVTILSDTMFQYNMKGTPTGVSTGTIVTTKGAASTTFCFSTLQAPNFFGFDYARYITGCEEGFSKSAIATDVTVGMLESQVGSTAFNPDAHITEFFGVQLKFGTAAGKYITYKWDRLQLTNVKGGKVASFLGRDVTFRNTGSSYIIYQ